LPGAVGSSSDGRAVNEPATKRIDCNFTFSHFGAILNGAQYFCAGDNPGFETVLFHWAIFRVPAQLCPVARDIGPKSKIKRVFRFVFVGKKENR
jgi:hypothetical protein